MAIAPVQGMTGIAFTSPVSSVSGTWPGATTLGNCLFCQISSIGSAPGTITFPSGYSQIGATLTNGTVSTAIGAKFNAASESGAKSVSVTNSQSILIVDFEEYSGVATSSEQDGSNVTNTGNSGTLTTGNVTVNFSTDLVLGCFAIGNASASTHGVFTTPVPTGPPASAIRQQAGQNDATDTSNLNAGFSDLLPAATGTFNMGVSDASGRTWVAIGIALKAAGAAAGPLFTPANLTTGSGGPFFSNPVTKWDGRRQFEQERLARMGRQAHDLRAA